MSVNDITFRIMYFSQTIIIPRYFLISSIFFLFNRLILNKMKLNAQFVS